MAKLNKRQKLVAEKVEIGKAYSVEDAVALLNSVAHAVRDVRPLSPCRVWIGF